MCTSFVNNFVREHPTVHPLWTSLFGNTLPCILWEHTHPGTSHLVSFGNIPSKGNSHHASFGSIFVVHPLGIFQSENILVVHHSGISLARNIPIVHPLGTSSLCILWEYLRLKISRCASFGNILPQKYHTLHPLGIFPLENIFVIHPLGIFWPRNIPTIHSLTTSLLGNIHNTPVLNGHMLEYVYSNT